MCLVISGQGLTNGLLCCIALWHVRDGGGAGDGAGVGCNSDTLAREAVEKRGLRSGACCDEGFAACRVRM